MLDAIGQPGRLRCAAGRVDSDHRDPGEEAAAWPTSEFRTAEDREGGAQPMFQPLRAMLREPETRVLVVAALSVVAVGTIVYVLLEGWSVLDAVYFCVVTLATVGYGDLHPTTELGRLFTIVYIIVGVGIIAGFISQLAAHRQAPRRLERDVDRVIDEVDRVV